MKRQDPTQIIELQIEYANTIYRTAANMEINATTSIRIIINCEIRRPNEERNKNKSLKYYLTTPVV